MTVVRDELVELKAAEVMIRNNARTPEQLKVMKTSELVTRISIFVAELNTYKQQMDEGGVMHGMAEEEPELFNFVTRMTEITTQDLAMAAHELDLRVPVKWPGAQDAVAARRREYGYKNT